MLSFAAIAVSTLMLASTSMKPGAQPTELPYALQEAVLDNGLRVVVVQRPGTGMFALYEVVGTGSRDEVEPGKTGFAHLFEHIMLKGTQAVPADKRTAILSSLGVDESGYTTDDFTTYHLHGPSEAFAAVVELEADRFMHLQYSQEMLKLESRALLGEYDKRHSNPDRQADDVLRQLAFDKHPYKNTTMGLRADIENMPNGYAYSRSFFERYYVPDNVIVYVVGDVVAADAIAAVKAKFGAWRGTRHQAAVVSDAPLTQQRRTTVAWDKPTQTRLHVAWRVPSAVRDPHAGALALLLQGYAFSDTSELAKVLVLKEQHAQTLSANYQPHRDAALFAVVVRVNDGHDVELVLARVQTALDAIAAGAVDAQRFEAVRANLRYGVLMQLTSSDRIAATLAYQGGPAMDPHALNDMLDSVAVQTPADLVQFVKANFSAHQRAVVVLSSSARVGGAK